MRSALLALLLLFASHPASAGWWDFLRNGALSPKGDRGPSQSSSSRSPASTEPTVLTLGSDATAEVQLLDAEQQAKIKIELPDGTRQVIAGLGEHWQFVRQEAESKLLAVQDFDGDGREDFVVRVSIPSRASQVYVYHYDAELGKFVPFLFADDDRLTADYNEPVEVLPGGITFAAEGAPASARRLWRFNGKRFLPF